MCVDEKGKNVKKKQKKNPCWFGRRHASFIFHASCLASASIAAGRITSKTLFSLAVHHKSRWNRRKKMQIYVNYLQFPFNTRSSKTRHRHFECKSGSRAENLCHCPLVQQLKLAAFPPNAWSLCLPSDPCDLQRATEEKTFLYIFGAANVYLRRRRREAAMQRRRAAAPLSKPSRHHYKLCLSRAAHSLLILLAQH